MEVLLHGHWSAVSHQHFNRRTAQPRYIPAAILRGIAEKYTSRNCATGQA
jgi:hypothetical protein